jgi:hypothetical protein
MVNPACWQDKIGAFSTIARSAGNPKLETYAKTIFASAYCGDKGTGGEVTAEVNFFGRLARFASDGLPPVAGAPG